MGRFIIGKARLVYCTMSANRAARQPSMWDSPQFNVHHRIVAVVVAVVVAVAVAVVVAVCSGSSRGSSIMYPVFLHIEHAWEQLLVCKKYYYSTGSLVN